MSAEYIMPIVWLCLCVVFVIIEFATQGITTIWFAGGSVLGLFAAALDASLLVQIILFLVVSVVLLIFTRPALAKIFNGRLEKTNIETLMGVVAVVSEDIDNLKSVGTVLVNGMEWSARSISDSVVCRKDEKVVVKNIEGVKLIVEKVPDKQAEE